MRQFLTTVLTTLVMVACGSCSKPEAPVVSRDGPTGFEVSGNADQAAADQAAGDPVANEPSDSVSSGATSSNATAASQPPNSTNAAATPVTDTANADRPDTATPAASAMSTIFSPARAPKRKTMGLLQRSFLDLADQGDQELEVAIVVDGTDSMSTELAGVRSSIHQMLEDLRRFRNNDVRVALVIYRDAGSPSGEVEIPLKKFSSDKQAIEEAVQKLQPESGAPFFNELTDEGIHQALTALPWTDDDQVTKWILLFGDAPPYSEAYRDPNEPDARRRYADSILISIAKRKNIRINCVLCTSAGNVSMPYEKVVDETRAFMNSLAGGTDGLMLDLSYEAIRTAMIDAARQPDVQLAKIEPIAAIDLAAVRRNQTAQSGNTRTVSLAVVPHMPLSQISFAADNPAVQVSTALRSKLSQVPGVRVASPRDIKEQLRRLRAEGVKENQTIRGLAGRLGVDFVVWGSLVPDKATYQTAAYRRDDGQQLVAVSLANHPNDSAYALIQASAKSVPEDQALAQLLSSMNGMQATVTAPMASSQSTNDELLTAIEALDQALEYEAGSEDSVALLEQADKASRNARTAEPTNALAHWLQANVAYNQASRLYQIGDGDAARAKMAEMRASLAEAVKNRESIASPSLVTEIEADYYLLVARDANKAVERYIAMTKLDQPLQSQLRGHWMLAGIYAGDWGTAEQAIVDPANSRRHITEILANWPDSPESKLLKEWLRWDDTQEQTQFNYLPKVNMGLTGA